MNMFCYQCEQAAGGVGCTKVGMCGKNGQWMWVGTGGPYMRIKNMQVGGYRQKVPGSTVILS